MPNSSVRIDGPDPALLDTRVEGFYQVLLRIEATDDKEANSEIGNGALVKTGEGGLSDANAGNTLSAMWQRRKALVVAKDEATARPLDLMLPLGDAAVDASRAVTFEWIEVARATSYRIEVESDGKLIITSTVQGHPLLAATGLFATRVQGGALWRVTALDASGRVVAQSAARRFALKG